MLKFKFTQFNYQLSFHCKLSVEEEIKNFSNASFRIYTKFLTRVNGV
jgi:hypothetical protein